jgi:hypothetical protein
MSPAFELSSESLTGRSMHGTTATFSATGVAASNSASLAECPLGVTVVFAMAAYYEPIVSLMSLAGVLTVMLALKLGKTEQREALGEADSSTGARSASPLPPPDRGA